MDTALTRLLLVDDDAAIRTSLARALSREGFAVQAVDGGRAALAAVAASAPDVAIVDLTMPDVDGIEVIRRLRAEGATLPILVLSARDEVEDRVAGLQAGADDYVTKPFAVAELVARLQALLRRAAPAVATELIVGDLRVDPARRRARRGERELDLTRREFELLTTLARHPSIVLTREQLLAEVWGYDFDTDSNVVDVFVGYLRRKLEAEGEPRLLHTVRGVGFVLRA
ncbi:MAG: response regulator transcription factor [Nitriliruptoraceae bacterium]